VVEFDRATGVACLCLCPAGRFETHSVLALDGRWRFGPGPRRMTEADVWAELEWRAGPRSAFGSVMDELHEPAAEAA
jgi:hypothetical protein